MKIKNKYCHLNIVLNKIFSLNLKRVIKLTRYFSKKKKNLIKFNNNLHIQLRIFGWYEPTKVNKRSFHCVICRKYSTYSVTLISLTHSSSPSAVLNKSQL